MKTINTPFKIGDCVGLKNGFITKAKTGKYIIAQKKNGYVVIISKDAHPLNISFSGKTMHVKFDSKQAIKAKIPRIPVLNKLKYIIKHAN